MRSVLTIAFGTSGPVALDKDTKKLNVELTENELPTWKKLEELVDKGKIRNIGVSK